MRRKILCALSALALALGSVVLVGPAASAAPDEPRLSGQLSGQAQPVTVVDPQLGIEGSNAIGVVLITVTVSNADGTDLPYCEAPVDPTSTMWSCLAPDGPAESNTVTGTLALGANELRITAFDGIEDSTSLSVFLYLTQATTITEPLDGYVTTSDTVRFSGTSEPGRQVTILFPVDELDLCTATTDLVGTWTCDWTPDSTGTWSFLAEGQDAFNDTTEERELTVNPAPPVIPVTPPSVVVPVPPVPAPTIVTPAAPTIAIAPSIIFPSGNLTAGDKVTVTGTGARGGTFVKGMVLSTPRFLGETVAADDGTFTLEATIPLDIEPGDHHLVITVTDSGGVEHEISNPVTVVAAQLEAEPVETLDAEEEPSGAAPIALRGGEPGSATEPNVLAHAIASFGTWLSNPAILGLAAAASLALLLLVAIPAELLNTAMGETLDRVLGKNRTRRPLLPRLRAWAAGHPVALNTSLLIAAAIIFCFADPEIGFDLASLRMFLACVIGLIVLYCLVYLVSRRVLRQRWNIAAAFESQPLALVFALIGVILTRILDFTPGFFFGLVLGLVVAGSTPARDRMRLVLTTAAITTAVCIIAWVGYSIVLGTSGGEPQSFLGALGLDVLVALPTEGLSGLLVMLLPLRALEGREIFRQSKLLWAASYFLTLLLFCAIVLPNAANWGEFGSDSLATWAIVAGGFAVISIVYYLLEVKPWQRDDDDEADALEGSAADHAKAGTRSK